MRVMILGGTGFIGSALTKELLRRGHDVVITSRSPHLSRKNFPEAYSPAHTGDGSSTDAYHILREEVREKGGAAFIPAFASREERPPSMPFAYAVEKEEEKASFWSSFGGYEQQKKHLVRDIVAAASGQVLPGSFWKTAEALGAISGRESEDLFFSYPEEMSSDGTRGMGWAQKTRAASYEVWDGADPKAVMPEVFKVCRKVESDCEIYF